MTDYMVWRLVKLVSVVLLAGGVWGTLLASARNNRLRSLWVATVGFVGAWVGGYAMMKLTGRTLSEPWIVWSVVASLTALHLSAILGHKEAPRRVTAWLAGGSLMVAVAVMVARVSDVGTLSLVSVAAALVGGALAHMGGARRHEVGPEDRLQSWRWFCWVARFEGLSWVLLLVAMPLKYKAQILLDGGTGVIGWGHGVLFVVYFQALWSASRFLGWSGKRVLQGAVLAFVPLGAFGFEWLVADDVRRALKEGSQAADGAAAEPI